MSSARRSKSPATSRPSSKKKTKKTTSPATRSILRADDETMISMLSAYTNSLNRLESPTRTQQQKGSPGRDLEANEKMQMLKMQLTEALEENAFVKSRLNAELKERHVIDSKYKELNKKFVESKKALQATGAALLQVHTQTSEMKNKRDEREVQLEEALNINRNLNSKIAELETRLEQALLSNGGQSTTTNTLKRLIEDKEELIKAMEEQQVELQGQMSKIRRDNYRLGDINAELTEAVEAKNRKIANLLKKATSLEADLEKAVDEGALVRTGSRSGKRPGSSGKYAVAAGANGTIAPNGNANTPHQLEERLKSFENLNMRMAQIELSIKQSESYAQLLRQNSAGMPMILDATGSPIGMPMMNGTYSGPNSVSSSSSIINPSNQAIMLNSPGAMTPTSQVPVQPGGEKPTFSSPRMVSAGGVPFARGGSGAPLAPVPIESAVEHQGSLNSSDGLAAVAPAPAAALALVAAESENGALNGAPPSGSTRTGDAAEPSVGATSGEDTSVTTGLSSPGTMKRKAMKKSNSSKGSKSSSAGAEENWLIASAGAVAENKALLRSPLSKASSIKLSDQSGEPEFDFPTSSSIVDRYTEEAVDIMLKPDDDTEVFKERLGVLRKKVKRDIYAWTKSFVNENQRQPTKEERKNVAGAMFRAYSGSGKILKDLGVEGVGESTKMSASVKFSLDT